MRVLFCETHYLDPNGKKRTGSVDYWRVVSPARWLQKHTDWKIEIRKGAVVGENLTKEQELAGWEQIGKDFDIVFTSYHSNPFAFSYMKALKRMYGTKHVMDMDDSIINLPAYNPVADEYKGQKANNAAVIIREMDYMTVTNSQLKKELKKFREKGEDEHIRVLPNYIDLNVYDCPPHVEDDVVNIVYQGGQTHAGDMYLTPFGQAMPYLLGKYGDKIKFTMVGLIGPYNNFNGIKNVEYVYGAADFDKWVEIWKQNAPRWDIGVAPLETIDFNLGKSPIKWLEYSAARIPTVVSDVGPYGRIQTGKTGFKCRTTKEWIEYLSHLIESPERRKLIGQQAYEEVKNKYCMADHWQEWKQVLVDIMQKPLDKLKKAA